MPCLCGDLFRLSHRLMPLARRLKKAGHAKLYWIGRELEGTMRETVRYNTFCDDFFGPIAVWMVRLSAIAS